MTRNDSKSLLLKVKNAQSHFAQSSKSLSLLLKVKNAQSHFAQSSKSESWPSGFYAGLLKNYLGEITIFYLIITPAKRPTYFQRYSRTLQGTRSFCVWPS
jgi:hypothetical protein